MTAPANAELLARFVPRGSVPGGRIVARAADGGSEGAVRIGDTEGTLELTKGAATFRSATGERQVTPGFIKWMVPSR